MRYVEIEKWENIKGFENYYQISDCGLVKSIDRKVNRNGIDVMRKGRVLSIWENHAGYFMVTLSKNAKHKHIPIHILIAKTFIPNPENKLEVNHLDGNKQNNSINNLEWCTRKENMYHSWNVLNNKYEGETHSLSKLTEKQVREIIELYKTGKYTYVGIAKQFNMEETQIHRIIKRQSWKHLKIA